MSVFPCFHQWDELFCWRREILHLRFWQKSHDLFCFTRRPTRNWPCFCKQNLWCDTTQGEKNSFWEIRFLPSRSGFVAHNFHRTKNTQFFPVNTDDSANYINFLPMQSCSEPKDSTCPNPNTHHTHTHTVYSQREREREREIERWLRFSVQLFQLFRKFNPHKEAPCGETDCCVWLEEKTYKSAQWLLNCCCCTERRTTRHWNQFGWILQEQRLSQGVVTEDIATWKCKTPSKEISMKGLPTSWAFTSTHAQHKRSRYQLLFRNICLFLLSLANIRSNSWLCFPGRFLA